MPNTDDTDSIETWLGVLRADVEETPLAARERIGARLAQAALGAGVLGTVVGAEVASRGFLKSKLFAVLLALPAGATLGAFGHAWLARPAVVAPAAPALRAPVVAPVPPAPAEPAPAVSALEPALVPPVASGKARSTASAPASEGLERELRLLEQARTKLSEGQANATLALLREHHRTYPSSVLEQERAALRVRTLVAAGRTQEARQQAAAFVQRFPQSVLRGSVERAVGTIP